MYFYSRSQQNQLYTAPTFSTEQIQSFDSLHHQNQDGSLFNSKSVLTPSALSSTVHESNPTDSENTNDSSSTNDKITNKHGIEYIGLPQMKISNIFETENAKFTENQLIQNLKPGNTDMTQESPICTLTSAFDPLEPKTSQMQDENLNLKNSNHENSKLYLLNPIFLLARLRTPQDAFQLLTEKKISNLAENNDQNEEPALKARGMLAYDSNIFEKLEINSISSKSGSYCESSSSICSLDSLFTDMSLETPVSQYTPNSLFIKDIGIDFMAQVDDSSKEEISEIIVDPIQNLENTSNIKEISEFEDASKSISDSKYIYSTEIIKKSQDTSENAHGNSMTHVNSMMCFNELSFYQQLFLTPTKYHFMPYNPEPKCPLATLTDNFNFYESKFPTNSNKSLTKYLSSYEFITHFANRHDQSSENDPNLLQRYNYKYPAFRIFSYENSNPEKIEKINDLTEDSLAAYQCALESAARNTNSNFFSFPEKTVSEEYLELKQELSQPSLSIDSYETSSQEIISLSDEFDDDFDFDDDSQDCAYIEAVNAEALANDFDGFYGQEFGLYSTPDVIGRNISYTNGGNSRTRYTHSRWNSRYWSREPLLSPITECSEFSFCSPYEPTVNHSSKTTGDITTSGIEQFQSGRLENDNEKINNFSTLLKSRQDLWGESYNSVQDFSNCSHWSSDSED